MRTTLRRVLTNDDFVASNYEYPTPILSEIVSSSIRPYVVDKVTNNEDFLEAINYN